MKPSVFVSSLRSAVVEENVGIYKDLFTSNSPGKVTDTHWRHALSLFNTLNREQQQTFFSIIRQVTVDTTSNVLGIIDGVSAIDGIPGRLELRYVDGSKLSGDLQSLFLAEEENLGGEA